MNSIIPFIAGLVILLCVIVAPIYCVVKLAEFKKRSTTGWGLFAVLGMAPSFILVSLLPSLRTEDEKKSYAHKFTRGHDKAGYVLWAVISGLLIGLFGFRYAYNPTSPILHGAWLHIHFVLLSIAFSATITASVFSLMRLRENVGFPAIILVLQNVNVILLFSSIIAGSIWANYAFGRSWGWDPKETWSIILFSTGIIAYTHTALRTPGVVLQIIISTVYLALFVFGVFVVPYTLPGLWPGFLLSR